MDLTVTPYAPPLGAAKPGNLYADLQTRTLWLGVDPLVDDAGAVLIADIVSMQADIEGGLVEAKAYTDTKIATRAPTVHTHTSTQISDFTPAVTAVASAIPSLQWVRGMILMYSGSLAEIGVGGLAGWSLCDGSNGTPDLRDRFVLPAGNKLPGATNPVTNLVTDEQGSHNHYIYGHVISIAEMPSHWHGSITGYVSHDHQHYVNLNTGGESVGHSHTIPGPATTSTSGGNRPSGSGGSGNNIGTSDRSAAHYHNTSGWTGGISQNHYHSIAAEGGYAAHNHEEAYAGAHVHNVGSNTLREAIPYYALAFIMKL